VDKYTIYEGKFPCKTCKKEVKTIRVYLATGMASWMCSEKHLSEVQLFKVGYKKVKKHE
jgi:deoxycytidylate deaminase